MLLTQRFPSLKNRGVPTNAYGSQTMPHAKENIFMSSNPQKQGMVINNANAIGNVSLDMLQVRAKELAAINGRAPGGTLKSDIAQAVRELTGGPESDPQTEVLESAAESERWNSLPGSSGHKVPPSPSEDEDEEGRTDNTILVEEGIAEAEHDQMLQAIKVTDKAS